MSFDVAVTLSMHEIVYQIPKGLVYIFLMQTLYVILFLSSWFWMLSKHSKTQTQVTHRFWSPERNSWEVGFRLLNLSSQTRCENVSSKCEKDIFLKTNTKMLHLH